MAERFSRVYLLPNNLYAENSPVVIVAGALLRDNETDNIIGQLKLKNISNHIIKEVVVELSQTDTAGREIEGTLEHRYMDLNVDRGETFGDKVAIKGLNSATRGISVKVKEITFDTKEVCAISNQEKWETIPNQEKLEEHFEDAGLIKQYNLDVQANVDSIMLKHKDLWICGCGEINHDNEMKCCKCGIEKSKLESVDEDKLKTSAESRVKEEEELRQKKEQEILDRKSEQTRKAKIIVPIVVVIAILVVYYTNIRPNILYNQVLSCIEKHEYEDAYNKINSISKISNYENGEQLLSSLTNIHDAKNCVSSGKYYEAVNLYNDVKRDFDITDELVECNYLYGKQLLDEGNPEKSYYYLSVVFKKKPDYKDIDKIIKDFSFEPERLGESDFKISYREDGSIEKVDINNCVFKFDNNQRIISAVTSRDEKITFKYGKKAIKCMSENKTVSLNLGESGKIKSLTNDDFTQEFGLTLENGHITMIVGVRDCFLEEYFTVNNISYKSKYKRNQEELTENSLLIIFSII